MLLSKTKVMFLVLFLNFGVMFLIKLAFLLRAGYAKGVVVETLTYHVRRSRMVNTIVEFEFLGETISFDAFRNLNYNRGDTVNVVFSKASPEDAYIYTFQGFWLIGLIITLVPFIFTSAIFHGLMNYNDKLEISRKKFFYIHKAKQ